MPSSVARRLRPTLLFLVAFASAAGLIELACGGGGGTPVCGNGVREAGEDCDLGPKNGQDGYTCSATCKSISVQRSSVTVTWKILGLTGVMGFDQASCESIKADYAEILLDAPKATLHLRGTAPCSSHTFTFLGLCNPGVPDGGDCTTRLPPGEYQATVTLFTNATGTAVTAAVSSSKTQVSYAKPTTLSIDYGLTDLLSPTPGSLNFIPSWGTGGTECPAAMPAVTKESLVLLPMGDTTPVMAKTILGTSTDGTVANCFVPDGSHTGEEVPNLMPGQYRLLVKGYSGSDAKTPTYCGGYDVFVGPGGRNNPFFNITIPAVRMTNPDGGSADGGAGYTCPTK